MLVCTLAFWAVTYTLPVCYCLRLRTILSLINSVAPVPHYDNKRRICPIHRYRVSYHFGHKNCGQTVIHSCLAMGFERAELLSHGLS